MPFTPSAHAWIIALFVALGTACSRPMLAPSRVDDDAETMRTIVRGRSMQGIVEDGDELIVQRGYYASHAPVRGDVVIRGHQRPLVKVVRAVPGDRFAVRTVEGRSELLINAAVATTTRGEPYSLDYGAVRMLGLYVHDYGGVVPQDAYLILGNVPTGSLDSTRFGLVHRNDLTGKVVATLSRR